NQIADLVTRGESVDLSHYRGGSSALRAVQRYESGEHAMIGVGKEYPFGTPDLTLPCGAVVFRRELVAFGDFYVDMDQLLAAPKEEIEALAGLCRFEAIWVKARLGGAQPPEFHKRMAHMRDQI